MLECGFELFFAWQTTNQICAIGRPTILILLTVTQWEIICNFTGVQYYLTIVKDVGPSLLLSTM